MCRYRDETQKLKQKSHLPAAQFIDPNGKLVQTWIKVEKKKKKKKTLRKKKNASCILVSQYVCSYCFMK